MKRFFEQEPVGAGAIEATGAAALPWWRRVLKKIRTRRLPDDPDADIEMSCY